jgi:hypothetical protein
LGEYSANTVETTTSDHEENEGNDNQERTDNEHETNDNEEQPLNEKLTIESPMKQQNETGQTHTSVSNTEQTGQVRLISTELTSNVDEQTSSDLDPAVQGTEGEKQTIQSNNALIQSSPSLTDAQEHTDLHRSSSHEPA